MTDRDETRGRFIAAIADQVDPEAIEEAHFFQPIKQGVLESGVAVVAIREGSDVVSTGAEGAAEPGPDALGASTETPTDAETPISAETRFAVYTARYRLTLKGPERGKFDFNIHAEADAPLVTVDRVVQGVQRRSGDAEDPERLSGEEFRALLPPTPPTPPASTQDSAQGLSA